MYTFCPNCFALYQVTAGHLGKAGGQTRCGECRQVYPAVDYLYDDLEIAREALQLQCASASSEKHAANEAAAAPAPSSATPGGQPASMPLHPVRPLPDSWQQQHTISLADIGSGAGIGFLLLLLGLQWVYFNRAELAADERWRPMLERGCLIVHCEMPLRADVSRIDIINRDVRKHPAIEDVLLVNVAFQNRAEFVQPYPVLEVSFTDKSGSAIAVRRFSPPEYLAAGVDLAAGMAAELPVQVVLEVIDPGDEVVSFQFAFL
ncbi:MAG: zinc-ribbon and DUF3426 domain-containing protein [Gammaproteobacteria bacterium]|nr:zinc-ribbon and DUF3426 domain-containing protein [Gammaproteobacteria bacterium]